jgi:hypothetical protein
VSLWHKIFGSPAEQTAKIVDEPPVEEGSPADLRNEPRSAGSGFADAHVDEPLLDEEVHERDRLLEGGEAGEEEGEPRRRSRRRGRGRGRGRGDDRPAERRGSRGESQLRRDDSRPDLEDEFTDEELMGDETVNDSMADDDDGDAGESEAMVSGAGMSRSAALQRSIPSWDDAIGFIVDSNMSQRSQRRPTSRSGGRENGSRGRGRGRRKS